jgi:hypothetical protein
VSGWRRWIRAAGSVVWLLVAVGIGVAGTAERIEVRILVGLVVALPAMLLIAFRAGRQLAAATPHHPRASGQRQRRARPRGQQRDPLQHPAVARSVTACIAVVAGISVWLSVRAGAPSALPDIALSSPALFHLQRAAVPALAAAFVALFGVRAATGYFPQKVSTTSAEWPAAAAEASAASASSAQTLEDLTTLVTQLSRDVEVEQQAREALTTRVVEATNRQGESLAALQEAVLALNPNLAGRLLGP